MPYMTGYIRHNCCNVGGCLGRTPGHLRLLRESSVKVHLQCNIYGALIEV